MIYKCEYCDKGVNVGHNVSHAKNRSRKISLPNLHWKRVEVSGKKIRVRLCTRCIRKLRASEPVRVAGVAAAV